MAGFTWKYNLSGGRPLALRFIAADTETLTKGDIGNVETGRIDLGATGDLALAGAILGALDPMKEVNSSGDKTPGSVYCTTAVTELQVIVNPDAIYGVTDANARNAGALLDLSGATGAQTVAAAANNEFVVVQTKRQTGDETLVMITSPSHYLAKVQ